MAVPDVPIQIGFKEEDGTIVPSSMDELFAAHPMRKSRTYFVRTDEWQCRSCPTFVVKEFHTVTKEAHKQLTRPQFCCGATMVSIRDTSKRRSWDHPMEVERILKQEFVML